MKVPLLKTRTIHASLSGSAKALQLKLATDQPETERLHIRQNAPLFEATICCTHALQLHDPLYLHQGVQLLLQAKYAKLAYAKVAQEECLN